MISDAQKKVLLEDYNRLGYLHVPGILSANLVKTLRDTMYSELEQLMFTFRSVTGVDLRDAEATKEFLDQKQDLAKWFGDQSRDIQHLIKGEFPLAIRERPEFKQLCLEAGLVDLMKTLFNDSALKIHYPPMLRFKVPGAKQALVPLHQDYPYFPHLEYFINTWIPFCSITDECGGVNVLERSHELGALEHQESVLWGKFVPREVGEKFVDKHITAEPGDVLLFGPHLLHYTHANTSNMIRCSIDTRWFASGIETTRQYLDIQSQKVIKMF